MHLEFQNSKTKGKTNEKTIETSSERCDRYMITKLYYLMSIIFHTFEVNPQIAGENYLR